MSESKASQSSPTRNVYKIVLTGGPCGGKTTGNLVINFNNNVMIFVNINIHGYI